MKSAKKLLPILTLMMLATAHGAVVLVIDVSNASAVTITALANNSLITGALRTNFFGGITIRNFFPTNQSITSAAPLNFGGSLRSLGAQSAFNEMVTFNFPSQTGDVVPGRDLSLYNVNAPDTDLQSLTSSAAPFTGTTTVNFSGFTLPTSGSSGDVNLGFLNSQGGVIGTYMVIPEPDTVMLGMLGAVALLRRKRARA
jgi:hypothetical protein